MACLVAVNAKFKPAARTASPHVQRQDRACQSRDLFSKNALQHDAGRRVLVCEVADQFPVVLNDQPFGDQVVLDHLNETATGAVLCRRSRRQFFGIEVRNAAELIDPFGCCEHVLSLIFRVFCKLLVHTLARDTRHGDRVHRVAEHADRLRRNNCLKQRDRLLDSTPVADRDGSVVERFFGALPERPVVGKKIVVGHLALP